MIGAKALLFTFVALFYVGCSSDDIKEAVHDFKTKYLQESQAGVLDDTGTVDGISKYAISIAGQESALLKNHEDARAEVGLGALSWDDRLAKDAQSYADTLAKSGAWEHDPKNHRGYRYGPYGENLYASTRKPSLEDASKAWVREKAAYHYGEVGDESTCDKGALCGHYTQIIWKETTHVGCAMSQYQTGEMKYWYLVVCKYKVPGNYIGQTPY